MSNTKTELTDLSGELHSYQCKPFAFDEAFDLGLKLAGIVGGPLGEALKGMLLGSELDDLKLDERVIGSIAGTLGELPGRIAAAGGSVLIARVLAQTWRKGDDGTRQLLGEADDRTEAYSGGNLREGIDAVRWVLMVNYGPFLTGLWGELAPQLAELESLRNLSQGSETENSEPSSNDLKPVEIV